MEYEYKEIQRNLICLEAEPDLEQQKVWCAFFLGSLTGTSTAAACSTPQTILRHTTTTTNTIS